MTVVIRMKMMVGIIIQFMQIVGPTLVMSTAGNDKTRSNASIYFYIKGFLVSIFFFIFPLFVASHFKNKDTTITRAPHLGEWMCPQVFFLKEREIENIHKLEKEYNMLTLNFLKSANSKFRSLKHEMSVASNVVLI